MWRGRTRERVVKERLVTFMEEKGVDPRVVSEWLWEEFGKRVKPSWRDVRRAIVRDSEVTPQDLVLLLYDLGLDVDESLWGEEVGE